MAKNLVIVESPAKAKTIEKFLGRDFKVTSSYGHIRDLSAKEISVDIEHDFEPKYVISEDKGKIVGELKKAVKTADCVWLASDEDREGEAIAWHLKETLNLEDSKTKRIVFNEITKTAIVHAVENPRDIDMNLVNAQQARRILDRIVGYEISPVLWKKVKPSLSAGRVQSVAVRLIVEREREINGFAPVVSYKVSGDFKTEKGKVFTSLLNKRFADSEQVETFLNDCKDAEFRVCAVETKPTKQSPAAPFTTSTLQQEASRRLGFSVSKTMLVAQQLYEAGFITYMRTDSVNLSDFAIGQAKDVIIGNFGEEYLQIRKYANKIKGAQEAHEAIRPTDLSAVEIDADASGKRLYELIRRRTLASLMADAKLEKTTVNISISGRPEMFVAQGEVLLFDGFLKVYNKIADSESEEEYASGVLPKMKDDEPLEALLIKATQSYTTQPPRYNEAALVKKMEELGIGRPSTYAPTISTIQKRDYVVKDDRPARQREIQVFTLKDGQISRQTALENYGNEKSKLFPTDIGIIVNDFLNEHFTDVIDYNFTAEIEKKFDLIAQGREDWRQMLGEFYGPFHHEVEATKSSDRSSGERLLGTDPSSNRPVYAKIGRFGPMIQIGKNTDEEKPRFASLTKNLSINNVTLEQALALFSLPRVVGIFEGEEITVNTGKFGPYLKYAGKNISFPKGTDPITVDMDTCLELINQKKHLSEFEPRTLVGFEGEDIVLSKGRYGFYLKHGTKNYRIPKTMEPLELTAEQALDIVQGKVTNNAALKSFASGIEILDGKYGPYIKFEGKNYKIPKESDYKTLEEEDCRKIIESAPAGSGRKTRKK